MRTPTSINKFHPQRQAEPYDSSSAGHRADRGQAAVAAWRKTTSSGYPGGIDESNIRDTICDVLHYAHKMWSRKNGYGGEDPVEQAECGLRMWRDESKNPE
jgi:hypothetical protein